MCAAMKAISESDANISEKSAKSPLRTLAINRCCLTTKDLRDVVVDAGRWQELLLAEQIRLFEKQLHLLVKSLGAALHSKAGDLIYM
jgi:hypothetical protein